MVILDNLEGPFVLAINAPWGTGKTILIRMLKASIEKQDYHCLYFNAWATDFFNDPLVAFLGELVSNVPQSISGAKKFQGYIEKSKILATAIAKKALPIAGKFVTHGLLDLEK